MSTTQAPQKSSSVLSSLLWTERYRPRDLSSVGMEEESRRMLQGYLEAGEIPHIFLVGPPGSGKTTTALILIAGIDCSHITFNASVERGIDVVRQKIGLFATAMTRKRWNIVFLDEGDQMTADAQNGLRNMMESYSERTRFIITANQGHKVIGPLQSRCQVITLSAPPLKERYRVLANVMKQEGITVTNPQVLLGYAEKYPDMRQMLFNAQKAYLGSKDKTLPPASKAGATNGQELMQMLNEKNFTAVKRLAASGDFDPAAGLREVFWSVPDTHPRVGFLRDVIGRGVHESGFTPDPVILFIATMARAMEGI